MTTDFIGADPHRRVPLARPSERGAATRSALLAAARVVFISQGYAQAGVTEIVTLAGASVGSLYHHYAGKADLYLALFDELHNNNAERTRSAEGQVIDRSIVADVFLVAVPIHVVASVFVADARHVVDMFSYVCGQAITKLQEFFWCFGKLKVWSDVISTS